MIRCPDRDRFSLSFGPNLGLCFCRRFVFKNHESKVYAKQEPATCSASQVSLGYRSVQIHILLYSHFWIIQRFTRPRSQIEVDQ